MKAAKLSPAYREHEAKRLRAELSGLEEGRIERREHLQKELAEMEKDPSWSSVPEDLVASIETGYQRYLAQGRRT